MRIKGFLKVESTMDQNTFIIMNQNSQFVGELIITEAGAYQELQTLFREQEKLENIHSEDSGYISPKIVLPISMTIDPL